MYTPWAGIPLLVDHGGQDAVFLQWIMLRAASSQISLNFAAFPLAITAHTSCVFLVVWLLTEGSCCDRSRPLTGMRGARSSSSGSKTLADTRLEHPARACYLVQPVRSRYTAAGRTSICNRCQE